MPRLLIVIGANGAGKTTWCRRHIGEMPPYFYDADSIAQGLGGYNDPEHQRSARRMIDRLIAERLERLEDFGFESTYSARRALGSWQRRIGPAIGWRRFS